MNENIVLIGQAQKIKSELGVELSPLLNMLCFDCDEFLRYEITWSVDEIVSLTSKTYLKKQIKKLAEKLEDYQNTVFVSSNLTELTEVELKKMRKNCYIIFLKSEENAKYQKLCNLVVSVDGKTLQDLVCEVKEAFSALN